MSAKESSRTWGQRRGRHRVALEGAVVHGGGAGGRPRAVPPPFLPARAPHPALRLSLPIHPHLCPSFHPTPERFFPHLSPCPPFYPSLHPPPPAPPRWFLAPRSFLGQGRGARGRGLHAPRCRSPSALPCCSTAPPGPGVSSAAPGGTWGRGGPLSTRLLRDSPHNHPIQPRPAPPFSPGDTYEFCFSRCRTFLCSSWFWAVHADILGDREKGVRSGGTAGSPPQPGAGAQGRTGSPARRCIPSSSCGSPALTACS